ncbi:Hypothetical predicted protein, partial [Prunus dulcis]
SLAILSILSIISRYIAQIKHERVGNYRLRNYRDNIDENIDILTMIKWIWAKISPTQSPIISAFKTVSGTKCGRKEQSYTLSWKLIILSEIESTNTRAQHTGPKIQVHMKVKHRD